LTAFVDSNALVRHLTGEPVDQAQRATAALEGATRLLLADLVVAETVFVLESVYDVDRSRVAELMRTVLGFPAIRVVDAQLLLRALEIYELDHFHFVEAYLAACAEDSGVGAVLSFDREIDRLASVERIEPGGALP
jgi:predicted nucleic-acid-binding protein